MSETIPARAVLDFLKAVGVNVETSTLANVRLDFVPGIVKVTESGYQTADEHLIQEDGSDGFSMYTAHREYTVAWEEAE